VFHHLFLQFHDHSGPLAHLHLTDPKLTIEAITRAASGAVTLHANGIPNAAHTVTTSPDLNPNSSGNPQTITADANGSLQYTDSSASAVARRFYGLTYP